MSGEVAQEEGTPTTPEIVLNKGTTQAFLKTREGGIVTRFRVEGVDVLFPDQFFKTSEIPLRRGGVPLLFPNAGPLPKGNEKYPNLGRHGFARNKSWAVKDMSTDYILLGLTSDNETKDQYPYDFYMELRISVDDGTLREELSVTNRSQEAMPVSPGFHPYFLVPKEKREEIKTNIPGFNPTDFDWNSSPDFPRHDPVLLSVPGYGKTSIKSSGEFQRLFVWSEEERPHLCIEPWTRGVGAILDPEERIEIQPGETLDLWMEISFQKTSD